MYYSSMTPKPLNNCLNCFTLKQCTVLIAIVQLFAAGIAVTFCILALTHAVDIREMVARDAEDAMDRGIFEDDNSMRLNIKRMEIAGYNAESQVDKMWCRLFFGVVHLIFIIFLLYGVLTNHRIFMMPWIYLNIVESSMIIALLVRNKPISNLWFFVLMSSSTAIINFYSIYVVWSTYVSLNKKKGLIHEIHDTKKNQSIAECSSSSSRLATEPYEV